MKRIFLPDTLRSIGGYAFSLCDSLTSVLLPEGLTELGNSPFYYCKSLSSVSIPFSVTTLGTSLFHGCPSTLVVTVIEGSEADKYRIENSENDRFTYRRVKR